MRATCSAWAGLISILAFLPQINAVRLIESKSLNTCQDNSSLTASLFNVVFTPNNLTLTFDIVGVSSIQGNVTFDVDVTAYGYKLLTKTLDPCTMNLPGMCPMNTGQLDISSNIDLDQSVVDEIPGIAYTVPDLDASVKVIINGTTDPDVSLACVEASLSNGKTVDQKGVGWTTAIIAGLALVASAVTSGLGHSNTAAHVAANALSLFGYFQAQAIVGLTAVHLPPIVQSWTQNFDWSMGIIEVDFMQSIATWYQRSTGGTPATLLNTLTTTSVEIEKRSIGLVVRALEEAHAQLNKRSSSDLTGTYVVKGMKRVAFRAGIESTNLFLTGLAFFCIFVVFTVIGVAVFKGYCEMAVRAKWMKSDKFMDFRNGWLTVLKGIMFRMVLIGFPQMTILCLWEFTQVDSAAEVVLAVFFFIGMLATLTWAALKVFRIAKRSEAMHKNPAYILYSDPAALNKWGFLYVQFRATAYYFIFPVLFYILIKGMFVAFAQGNGNVQAIAFVIIEFGALIAASVLRPWMDKGTNGFNISIYAINALNAIFLLVFTGIFNQPDIVTGVMGVIFFVYNAIFSLVLLLLVLISTVYALVRKNPDTRYQPMTDDRASFIKSQSQLTTELDALGATARGDMKGGYKHNLDLDEDGDSWSSDSLKHQSNAAAMPLPPSTANTASSGAYGEHNRSPVDPSVPLFPSNNLPPQPQYRDDPRNTYQSYDSRQNSDIPLMSPHRAAATPSPSPYHGNSSATNVAGYRLANDSSPSGYRTQNNARYVPYSRDKYSLDHHIESLTFK
jgi:hypothetical protein